MTLETTFTLEKMRDLYYGSGPHDFLENESLNDQIKKARQELHLQFAKPGKVDVLSLTEFAESAGYNLLPSSVLSEVISSWVKPRSSSEFIFIGKNAAQPWFKVGASLRVVSNKKEHILHGTVDFVLDGAEAAGWLIFAKDSAHKLSLFEVKRDDPGVKIERLVSADPSYPLARITLKKTKLASSRKVKAPDLEKLTMLETLLHSAASMGAARRACDIIIDHSKKRQIGGGPIARFQSLSHRIVNMHIAIEKARSLVGYAAAAWDQKQEPGLAISMAKTASEKALIEVAQDGIQIHGAEAFQWIHPMNFFFRRGLLMKTLFGTTADHYDLVAQAVLKPVKRKNKNIVPLASFDKER